MIDPNALLFDGFSLDRLVRLGLATGDLKRLLEKYRGAMARVAHPDTNEDPEGHYSEYFSRLTAAVNELLALSDADLQASAEAFISQDTTGGYFFYRDMKVREAERTKAEEAAANAKRLLAKERKRAEQTGKAFHLLTRLLDFGGAGYVHKLRGYAFFDACTWKSYPPSKRKSKEGEAATPAEEIVERLAIMSVKVPMFYVRHDGILMGGTYSRGFSKSQYYWREHVRRIIGSTMLSELVEMRFGNYPDFLKPLGLLIGVVPVATMHELQAVLSRPLTAEEVGGLFERVVAPDIAVPDDLVRMVKWNRAKSEEVEDGTESGTEHPAYALATLRPSVGPKNPEFTLAFHSYTPRELLPFCLPREG